ncbi:MAG: hypothetical protein K2J38_05400 [Muribaculaceae bacterium]|nr:hypothetical protein [Muribaculaceae bacterium]
MEEDRLRDILQDFSPAMTPDSIFMSRLEEKLRSVELVKQQLEQQRRRNRLAIVLAAFTGFICGIVSALCYPALAAAISASITAGTAAARLFSLYGSEVTLTIMCMAAAVVTYTVYDITMLLSRRSAPTIGLRRE